MSCYIPNKREKNDSLKLLEGDMEADYHLEIFAHAFPSFLQPAVLLGSFATPAGL
jgi:hypothetical protein